MSVNKVILVGRLGKDPESRRTQNDTLVVKFTLATDRSGPQGGEGGNGPDWHNIVCFGKTAELCERYLTKGRQVYIEGRIEYSKQEKDGVTRYFTSIVANNVQFLSSGDGDRAGAPAGDAPSRGSYGGSSGGSSGGGSRSPAPARGGFDAGPAFDDISDSDIPF
jgi:single-strand DNA-binding protein